MGGRAFLLYYLYCGIGAAVFAWLLSGFMSSAAVPVIGRVGRGARRGRRLRDALARRRAAGVPAARCRSRRGPSSWCSSGSTSCSRWSTPNDGIAHLAHVGGAGFGYLFFRLQALSRRSPHPPPRAVERVVMVQSGAAEPEHRTPPAPLRPRRRVGGRSRRRRSGPGARQDQRAGHRTASRPPSGASWTRSRGRRSRSPRQSTTAKTRKGGRSHGPSALRASTSSPTLASSLPLSYCAPC